MWEKTFLENAGTLNSVPNCHKNKKMCNKAVDNHVLALESVSDCYKTQKECNKAVNTSPSAM